MNLEDDTNQLVNGMKKLMDGYKNKTGFTVTSVGITSTNNGRCGSSNRISVSSIDIGVTKDRSTFNTRVSY